MNKALLPQTAAQNRLHADAGGGTVLVITFNTEDSGTLGILTLRGDIAHDRAGELHARLAQSFCCVNRLIVNCNEVASFDMACIRVLCAAYRVSHLLHKDFSLVGDQPGLYARAERHDIVRSCPDRAVCGEGCLWT